MAADWYSNLLNISAKNIFQQWFYLGSQKPANKPILIKDLICVTCKCTLVPIFSL